MDEQKQVIDPNVNATGQLSMNLGKSETGSLAYIGNSVVKDYPIGTIKDQPSPPNTVNVLTPETHLNIIEKVETKVQAKIDEVINDITASFNKEEDKVKKEVKDYINMFETKAVEYKTKLDTFEQAEIDKFKADISLLKLHRYLLGGIAIVLMVVEYLIIH